MEQVRKSCPQKLVDMFGGSPSNTARKVKVERQNVFNWLKAGYIPTQHALDIYEITEGKVDLVEMLKEAREVKPPKIKCRE